MRTNIEIDDDLMAAAMAAGGFKTKKEAVEEGLRMLKRKKAYADLLAARGTLFWDDSDEAWARARQESEAAQTAVQEPVARYEVAPVAKSAKVRAARTGAKTSKRGQAS